jgi:hypothetical protein
VFYRRRIESSITAVPFEPWKGEVRFGFPDSALKPFCALRSGNSTATSETAVVASRCRRKVCQVFILRSDSFGFVRPRGVCVSAERSHIVRDTSGRSEKGTPCVGRPDPACPSPHPLSREKRRFSYPIPPLARGEGCASPSLGRRELPSVALPLYSPHRLLRLGSCLARVGRTQRRTPASAGAFPSSNCLTSTRGRPVGFLGICRLTGIKYRKMCPLGLVEGFPEDSSAGY